MIDPASPLDGDRILAITAQIDNFSDSDKRCVQELWQDCLTQGSAASGYYFLVYRDEGGRVLGYICYGPTPLTAGTFDVYWLAVDPASRHQGIGRALLAQAEREIVAAGGRLVLIETSGSIHYQTTRRFYESCGYHYQAVVHDFYAQGEDLLIFSKNLRAVPAAVSI
jgi:D-alanine-D-alanine ligase